MQWATFEKMVVFRHTLFGLPWLVISIALAFADASVGVAATLGVWKLAWMLLAFASARTSAMAFNRLVDEEQDGLNPRTRDRVLPSGEASAKQVRLVAWVSVLVFVASCAAINTLTLFLAPVSILLQWGYSYAKHFTPYCHFVMALNHFLLPIFVWAALTGTVTVPAIVLGTIILAFIGANDVVYGIPDVGFDKRHGLHSIPSALGVSQSLWIVRTLHVVAVVLLVKLGMMVAVSPLYYLGVVVTAALCVFHNLRLDPKNPKSVYAFMYYCNIRVGFCLMIFSLGSVVWPTLS